MSHPEIPVKPLTPSEIGLGFFNRLKAAKSPADVKLILGEITTTTQLCSKMAL